MCYNPSMAKQELRVYRCKTKPLTSQRYVGIIPQARNVLRSLQKRTKRRMYVRSVYFRKGKIFFDHFWQHLNEKSLPDRARRLKYLPCALELLRNTRHDPESFIDSQQPGTIRHRFAGVAPDGTHFYVQLKEDRRSRQKQLISVFPEK